MIYQNDTLSLSHTRFGAPLVRYSVEVPGVNTNLSYMGAQVPGLFGAIPVKQTAGNFFLFF